MNLAKDYRGGERQTEYLVRELASRGWRQRLVARRGNELAERCADLAGTDVVATSSNLISAGRATRGTSLVHAHEARGVYAGWFATRVYGIPSMLTRRVVRTQKRSWLRDRAYRSASAVVGVSAAVAEHVRRSYPDLDPEVVYDGRGELPTDEASIRDLRNRYSGKTLIGHIGTYDHSVKGQLTIIDVARRAATERPRWHFLLLGEGRDRELFAQRIADLDNIELTGFVERIGDYLSLFDVFLLPSLHEALGSSMLDAMHFGVPVVASRVGGIPEFVEEGVNGFLMTPQSSDELMAGIDRIAGDIALAGSMSAANRQKAAAFTIGRMADDYEAIYRRILG
ncbi:MAG: glycosyltransferase family 4 protein [Woeseiaceae bacterium]|nr:glycosyltransferase family 4 protein [Woeseiaceae bacterium]